MTNKNELLLKQLQENARLSLEDLASSTGQSVADVTAALHKLEKDQTIVKYTAVLNPEKQTPKKIRALIELSVRPVEKTGYNAFAERIRDHKHVVDLYLVSGNYDFLVVLEGETLQEISDFVSEIASVENVGKTATHVVLKTFKQVGVSVGKLEPSNRIAIMP